MAADRIAVAQRGIVLADAVPARRAAPKRAAKKGAAKRKPPKAAAGALTGPFLSPGSLTAPSDCG
jgi:hypothetical protein